MLNKHLMTTAAALVLLGGCAGTPVVSGYAEYDSHYDKSTVVYAVKGGSMPLVVHGVPYNAPKTETDRIVADTMSMPGWLTAVPFELAPVASAPSGDYRVVVAFNADRFPGSRFLCGDLSDVASAPRQGQLRVHAAFCAGDHMVSQTFASGPTVNPDIAKLRRIMNQVTHELLPPENPDTKNDPNDGSLFRQG